MDTKKLQVGIIGAGTMGSGIAQVAATAGHQVKVFDSNSDVIKKASAGLGSTINKLI